MSSITVNPSTTISVDATSKSFPLAKRKRDGCECGARKEARYGVPGDLIARWCSTCPNKHPDAVNICDKRCQCGNSANPSFGDAIGRKIWCAKCKPKEAVKIRPDGNCECGNKRPRFGLHGDQQPRWCEDCPSKEPEAINICRKRCVCGRSNIPHFGRVDGIKIWCEECKPENAINLVPTKTCICVRVNSPCWGPVIGKPPIWCVQCKEQDAIYLRKDNMCQCGKSQANYGLADDKRPTWCAKCKPDNAENITAKKCECGKQPSFSLIGSNDRLWCAGCKPFDAVAAIKRCLCGEKEPTWGIPNQKPVWCRLCKESDAVLSRRKCLANLCDNMVSRTKYDGYCSHCFCCLFPDKPLASNYKTKERVIIHFISQLLASKFPQSTALYDKRIPNGVSKRRPDAFIDCITHCLVIECDEDGHDTEEYCLCENKRMMVKIMN